MEEINQKELKKINGGVSDIINAIGGFIDGYDEGSGCDC